ncbi:MAG: response regulator transcription factor [Saprospiraceae bacterium]|nr:response regulator transcription factor [Saprospiraceae bacterium]MCB9318523.1 response regulator transcription factor [Lewinellaceae bacterium]
MERIRTLVIDDEPLARARIIRLLSMYPEADLIGEARNGKEAILQMREHQPDLIFLDIHMPDLNGFEVLEMRGDASRPFIIFVTAYDQYAVQAFAVQAIDYLLKPYDDQRFARAYDHARHQILLNRHKNKVPVEASPNQAGTDQATFIVKGAHGIDKTLRYDGVIGIRADGNYLHVHTLDTRYLVRMTLAEMIERLPDRMFLRIHRSFVVNRLHISQVHYYGNNTYRFLLSNQMSWCSSRGHKPEIMAYLNES